MALDFQQAAAEIGPDHEFDAIHLLGVYAAHQLRFCALYLQQVLYAFLLQQKDCLSHTSHLFESLRFYGESDCCLSVSVPEEFSSVCQACRQQVCESLEGGNAVGMHRQGGCCRRY